MKKNEAVPDRVKKWRANVMHEVGPIGMAFLTELLRWNIDRLPDPASFSAHDHRRILLESDFSPARDRRRFKAIQEEIRNDLLSIFTPVAPSKDEPDKTELIWFWHGLANESPRRVRLRQLIWKLNQFDWKIGLTINNVGISRRISEAGETVFTPVEFEIESERFVICEDKLGSSPDLRTRLYWIIYNGLRTGEISRLRKCSNPACENLCVARRDTRKHCSDRCRNQLNNEARRDKFKDDYKKRKLARLKLARKRLEKDNSYENAKKVMEETRLTYKALEKAGLV